MSDREERSSFSTSAARLSRVVVIGGVLVVLAAAALAVYWRGIHAPFVFDDVNAIVKNPSIHRLWPLGRDADGPGPLDPPVQTSVAGRPLVNLSLAINYRLGRLDPRGYHELNLALHVVAATLLWAIVRRTLLLEYFAGRFQGSAGVLALAVALIWALHPLQADSVQYVVQRTEVLMACCYLATFYGSLRYWDASSPAARRAWLVAAWSACAAGMACKESMVTAPIVVLLAERTFVAGSFRQALRRSWPLYAGLSLSWLLLAALNHSGPRSASAGYHLGVPAHVWWLTQTEVLWMYLKLAAWPWPLLIHYELPYRETLAAAWPWVAATVTMASGTLVLFWQRTAAGFLAVAALLMLSPTLLVPITSEVAAERRMYLPLATIVAGAIVGALVVARRFRNAQHIHRTGARVWPAAIVCGLAVALAGTLGAVSARRVAMYNDPVELWQDVVVRQPQNARAQKNLGIVLVDAGRPQEAVTHYETALKLQPGDAETENNLGVALAHLRRFPEALLHLSKAIELDADNADAYANLGHALAATGQFDQAIDHYQQALTIDPAREDIYGNLCHALLGAQRIDEAIAQFELAVRRHPDSPEARLGLGHALVQRGELDAAIVQFERAVALRPDYAVAHNNLGIALAAGGRYEEAAERYRQALRSRPDYVEAYANLATALASAGDTAQAIATAEKASELARSQGQAALSDQIDAWLNGYRASLDADAAPGKTR